MATKKRKIWYPIAVALSAINVAAVAQAAQAAEPWHATGHAVLGVAFAFWAVWLRPGAGERALAPVNDALAAEIDVLRQELLEAQERMDFLERMLAQGPDPLRVSHQGRQQELDELPPE
jgi:hypothetical protein